MPTNVLLVEDDPGDALLVTQALRMMGCRDFTITHVLKLADALRKLVEETFEVVLLDLSLPDSFGHETIARVIEAAPDVPIVVLTSLDDDQAGLRALKAGAQDYLVKGQCEAHLLRRALHYAQQRKRADVTIRQLHHRNDLILRSLGEGVVGCDATGSIRFLNAAAVRLTGWRSDDLIGRDLHATLFHSHADGTPIDLCSSPIHLTALDGRVREIDGDVLWHRDGGPVPVDIIVTPIEDNGARTGLVVAFHDITGRQETLCHLRQQLTAQQTMFEHLPVPVFQIDPVRRLTACNYAFAALMGIDRHERIGLPLDTVLPAAVVAWLSGCGGGEAAFDLNAPDGRYRAIFTRTLVEAGEGLPATVLGTIQVLGAALAAAVG